MTVIMLHVGMKNYLNTLVVHITQVCYVEFHKWGVLLSYLFQRVNSDASAW